MTKEELIAIIAEYGNDLFKGESKQRWKSEAELVDYILKNWKQK